MLCLSLNVRVGGFSTAGIRRAEGRADGLYPNE